MKIVKTILMLALFSAFVAGCENTAAGMQKDADENKKQAGENMDNVKDGVNEAGQDIGAATMLTPKIKAALTADNRLNDPSNLIDVDSTSETVKLEGHVTSAELKELASDIALKALEENKATQKLENNLVVKAPAP